MCIRDRYNLSEVDKYVQVISEAHLLPVRSAGTEQDRFSIRYPFLYTGRLKLPLDLGSFYTYQVCLGHIVVVLPGMCLKILSPHG